MLDKDYGIKRIPHPQPEFKRLLLYRTERELYTYKSQKRFLRSFRKTLGQAMLPIRMRKCYNLELSEQ